MPLCQDVAVVISFDVEPAHFQCVQIDGNVIVNCHGQSCFCGRRTCEVRPDHLADVEILC